MLLSLLLSLLVLDCGITPSTFAPVKKRKRACMEEVVMVRGASLTRGILCRNFRTSSGCCGGGIGVGGDDGDGDGDLFLENVLRVGLLGVDAEILRRRSFFVGDGRGSGFGLAGGVKGAAELWQRQGAFCWHCALDAGRRFGWIPRRWHVLSFG